MKAKVIIVILAVVCAGLAIALFAVKKQNEEQRAADITSIMDFSNQVVSATVKINDLNQVNLALTNDLISTRDEAVNLSNNLATTSATLAASQSDLASAQSQITGLNSHVADLETQNKTLDERLGELTNQMAVLNAQIEETQKKLSSSEAGNAFLQ